MNSTHWIVRSTRHHAKDEVCPKKTTAASPKGRRRHFCRSQPSGDHPWPRSFHQSIHINDPVKSTAGPINLRDRFGRRFKVEHDPAFEGEFGRHRTDDAWLQIINGRYGHLFPIGGNRLAAWSNTRGPVANKLLASIR